MLADIRLLMWAFNAIKSVVARTDLKLRCRSAAEPEARYRFNRTPGEQRTPTRCRTSEGFHKDNVRRRSRAAKKANDSQMTPALHLPVVYNLGTCLSALCGWRLETQCLCILMSLTAYASITASEFSAACEALEVTSSDRLDGTAWVSLKWTGAELRIKQRRYIEGKRSDGRGYGFEVKDQYDEIEEDIIDGDDAEDVLSQLAVSDSIKSTRTEVVEVDFSVTLSPIYSVPILWFTSLTLRTIDQVHDALLPKHLDESLRSVGVMGGISQAVSGAFSLYFLQI